MYTYITTPSTKMNVYLYIRKILHSDGTMARWHDGTIITSRIMPGMSLYVNYTCTHHSNKIKKYLFISIFGIIGIGMIIPGK